MKVKPGKAKESPQILKARKKLKKQLEAVDAQISKKAIAKMKEAIRIWIDRHKSERVPLHKRKLFDANRHPEKVKSKYVSHLQKELKKEAEETKPSPPLAGRIKK